MGLGASWATGVPDESKTESVTILAEMLSFGLEADGLPATLELFFALGDTGELVELEGGGATEEESLGASPPVTKKCFS